MVVFDFPIRNVDHVADRFQPSATPLSPVVDTLPVDHIPVPALPSEVRPVDEVVVYQLEPTLAAGKEQVYASLDVGFRV